MEYTTFVLDEDETEIVKQALMGHVSTIKRLANKGMLDAEEFAIYLHALLELIKKVTK